MAKRIFFIILLGLYSSLAISQCSMCTKTAASLDDKSAKGLNSGIIYLAALPLIMMGFIGFKWWKQNKE
jgi:hypothetical protein